ncbi:hypothetical protein DPMN_177342 [Dreissena polymorpha]|uniref:Fork-head domain-containing protein n=1 Tax=Dreissena polymorpha TaxID=45954 RepID=A0A9D4E8U0_DREPO|nr:hypothetical protein DPMN_177342 [Dreissena polymorpha]
MQHKRTNEPHPDNGPRFHRDNLAGKAQDYVAVVNDDTGSDGSVVNDDAVSDVAVVDDDAVSDVAVVDDDTGSDVAVVNDDTGSYVAVVIDDTGSDVAVVHDATGGDVAVVDDAPGGDVAVVNDDTDATDSDVAVVNDSTGSDVAFVNDDTGSDVAVGHFGSDVAVVNDDTGSHGAVVDDDTGSVVMLMMTLVEMLLLLMMILLVMELLYMKCTGSDVAVVNNDIGSDVAVVNDETGSDGAVVDDDTGNDVAVVNDGTDSDVAVVNVDTGSDGAVVDDDTGSVVMLMMTLVEMLLLLMIILMSAEDTWYAGLHGDALLGSLYGYHDTVRSYLDESVYRYQMQSVDTVSGAYFSPNAFFTSGLQTHTYLQPLNLTSTQQPELPVSRGTSPEDLEVSFLTDQRLGFTHPESRCSSTETSISMSSRATVTSVTSNASTGDGNDLPSDDSGRRGKKRRRDDVGPVEYKRYPKPPYQYSGIIAMAIQSSPEKRLSLSQIVARMAEFFPFFRGSYTGWRDSVRHTLSHVSCFYKVAVQGCTNKAGKPTTKFNWAVDLSKVHEGMFRLQGSYVGKNAEFQSTLHEQLGLPPVMQHSSPTISERAVQDVCEDGGAWTGYSDTTGKFSMRLPSRGDTCHLPHDDSPYQYHRRYSLYDSTQPYEDLTPVKSEPKPDIDLNTPIDDLRIFLHHIARDHVTNPTRNSDAVDNLSALCNPEAPGGKVSPKTEPPAGYTDVTSSWKAPATSAERFPLRWTDFSVSNFLRPISPERDSTVQPADVGSVTC